MHTVCPQRLCCTKSSITLTLHGLTDSWSGACAIEVLSVLRTYCWLPPSQGKGGDQPEPIQGGLHRHRQPQAAVRRPHLRLHPGVRAGVAHGVRPLQARAGVIREAGLSCHTADLSYATRHQFCPLSGGVWTAHKSAMPTRPAHTRRRSLQPVTAVTAV